MSSSRILEQPGVCEIHHFDGKLRTVDFPGNRISTGLQGASRPGLKSQFFSDNRLLKQNDQPTEQSYKMSVTFQEVFKDFSQEMKENSVFQERLGNLEKPADVYSTGELNLLNSSDNVRPKSRGKTVIYNDLNKVSVFESNLAQSKTPQVTPCLNKHVEDTRSKNLSDTLSPVSSKEIANSAQDCHGAASEPQSRKGKKHRKRSSSSSKTKKGKHGRLLALATGLHTQTEKRTSVPAINSQAAKPSRVSSEPPSKISANCVLSPVQGGLEHDRHKHFSLSSTPIKPLHNVCTITSNSAKSNRISLGSENHMHSENSTHKYSDKNDIRLVNGTQQDLVTQGSSVIVYKLDIGTRVKSASSMKSFSTGQAECARENESSTTNVNTDLCLSAVPCIVQSNRPSKQMLKHHKHATNNSNFAPSPETNSQQPHKMSVLTSIYGAVYETADKVTAQAEEMKKVKKIYLSDKQSGTLRENGMEFPCAPPATPTPDVLRNHEYIPSMSDVRSQRAVKGRLQAMEKETLKKREKQKEAHAKMEKQQLKDRERQLKIKQRREIYALNKIMTELENKRFLEFCQAKGLRE